MRQIKTVIIDDEQPARDVIREYLEDRDEIEIVGEFGSPTKALTFLKEHDVDLCFLDIQMPAMTGFELVEALDELPRIIFSTAYDKYALRAFEINAVDYLLKPYTKERFDEALNRALDRIDEGRNEKERIEEIIRQTRQKQWYTDQIFVRTGKRIKPIAVDEIIWIEADGDYARIHFEEDSILSSKRLGELEDRLDPKLFTRVHRSSLIALNQLKELESDGYGGFEATMSDGSKVKVSRSYGSKIKDFMA
ncbi:MAG: response regulator [Bacteroidetes bacterium]|jgi:two-component system LytT family response regulator|nr:response regulator [Bacteroidota bacterium]